MFATMSISGIKVNLFNMVAAVLVIGLAVDYGIFIVCTCEEAPNAATCNAVLVSGLTTFVGFGSLIIARHPAMNSIGITVAAGIIPSLLCALTLLPYLTCKVLAEKKK
jgi:predicted exporter